MKIENQLPLPSLPKGAKTKESKPIKYPKGLQSVELKLKDKVQSRFSFRKGEIVGIHGDGSNVVVKWDDSDQAQPIAKESLFKLNAKTIKNIEDFAVYNSAGDPYNSMNDQKEVFKNYNGAKPSSNDKKKTKESSVTELNDSTLFIKTADYSDNLVEAIASDMGVKINVFSTAEGYILKIAEDETSKILSIINSNEELKAEIQNKIVEFISSNFSGSLEKAVSEIESLVAPFVSEDLDPALVDWSTIFVVLEDSIKVASETPANLKTQTTPVSMNKTVNPIPTAQDNQASTDDSVATVSSGNQDGNITKKDSATVKNNVTPDSAAKSYDLNSVMPQAQKVNVMASSDDLTNTGLTKYVLVLNPGDDPIIEHEASSKEEAKAYFEASYKREIPDWMIISEEDYINYLNSRTANFDDPYSEPQPYIVSVIKDVITPESAEESEYAESEFVHENEPMSEEEVKMLFHEYTFYTSGSIAQSPKELKYQTADPERDMYDGSETYYTIVIKKADGSAISASELGL